MSAYSGSKGAVIRFTESAAIELRSLGIRVNAVCPGIIASEMGERLVAPIEGIAPMPFDELIALKQGRMGTPEEVAEVVAFLLSNDAQVTDAHYMVDGAHRGPALKEEWTCHCSRIDTGRPSASRDLDGRSPWLPEPPGVGRAIAGD